MKSIAIILLVTGSFIFTAGLLLFFADKIPWLGNLPGDIHIKGKNSSFYFPITTCILFSIVLTVLINIILKLFGK